MRCQQLFALTVVSPKSSVAYGINIKSRQDVPDGPNIYTLFAKYYFLNLLAAKPIRPSPNRIRVPGSGMTLVPVISYAKSPSSG
jgi:hypothetical protein